MKRRARNNNYSQACMPTLFNFSTALHENASGNNILKFSSQRSFSLKPDSQLYVRRDKQCTSIIQQNTLFKENCQTKRESHSSDEKGPTKLSKSNIFEKVELKADTQIRVSSSHPKHQPSIDMTSMRKGPAINTNSLKGKCVTLNGSINNAPKNSNNENLYTSNLVEIPINLQDQPQKTYTITYLEPKDEGISMLSRRVPMRHLSAKQDNFKSKRPTKASLDLTKDFYDVFNLKGIDLSQSIALVPKKTDQTNDDSELTKEIESSREKRVNKTKKEDSTSVSKITHKVKDTEEQSNILDTFNLKKVKGWYLEMKAKNNYETTNPDSPRDDLSELNESGLNIYNSARQYTNYDNDKSAQASTNTRNFERRFEGFQTKTFGTGKQSQMKTNFANFERRTTNLKKLKAQRNGAKALTSTYWSHCESNVVARSQSHERSHNKNYLERLSHNEIIQKKCHESGIIRDPQYFSVQEKTKSILRLNIRQKIGEPRSNTDDNYNKGNIQRNRSYEEKNFSSETKEAKKPLIAQLKIRRVTKVLLSNDQVSKKSDYKGFCIVNSRKREF